MKNYLSFHTIFILNENIKWLEEFIIYYRNLGFDHFYLYDNEGSIGRNGSTKTHTKNGFPITTSTLKQDKDDFQKILLKYKDYITYIKWQPRDIKGNIIYGQKESMEHWIKKYSSNTVWIAFFDLDEFIFSVKDINLIDYLKSLDRKISCVKLNQKKFLDRFLTNSSLITQEFKCINNTLIYESHSPKNIIRCEDICKTRDRIRNKDNYLINNIHNVIVKFKTIIPQSDILRFNHYNINDKSLSWMNWFYKPKESFIINNEDNDMLRYKEIFKFD
jgi:hypothetical protein